jgi:hypothetical protein
MTVHHKELAAGRWKARSLVEQMANIGSEVERAMKWKNRGNTEYFLLAFERALELVDLTVEDEKNRHRLREVLRMREALADYFVAGNEYGSSDESWRRYFLTFAFAARNHT